MSEPLVFVTTHTIEDGQAQAVEQLAQRFARRVEESETGLVSFHFFIDEKASKIVNTHVHADSASMEAYLPIVQELIAEALPIAPAHRIEVFGTPGPMLRMALDNNAEAGATVVVVERHLAGFERTAVASKS